MNLTKAIVNSLMPLEALRQDLVRTYIPAAPADHSKTKCSVCLAKLLLLGIARTLVDPDPGLLLKPGLPQPGAMGLPLFPRGP